MIQMQNHILCREFRDQRHSWSGTPIGPSMNPFYLLINVASGGNFASAHETPDRTRYCHDAECSNLDVIPDKGRMLN